MMDFEVDIRTLLLTLVLGNLFTLLLITSYRRRYPTEGIGTWFVVAKWLQSLCWFLLLLRGRIPDMPFIPISNAAMLGGGGLEIVSLLSIKGCFGPAVRRYYIALSVFSVILYGGVYIVHNQENLRIAAASFAAMLFVVYPAGRFGLGREGSPLQRAIGLLYGGMAVIFAARSVSALQNGPSQTVFTPGHVSNLYYLGMFLLMNLGTAAFVLLSREQSLDELKRMAMFDELTGLLNRRSFLELAQPALDRARRMRETISFILMDIDHFKQVNDVYGHAAGDRVLREFAAAAGGALMGEGLLGRYGGEEFAVLLPGLDEGSSDETIGRLNAAIGGLSVEGVPLRYSVSIGVITLIPGSAATLDYLYRLSDTALYQAKREGRNRVVRVEPGCGGS
ncbi:GGDEF domain-containing protein [Paenibacillus spiritus]|uniref:GGDEF domain-containing protein n=1 Tax=Paenibacillus spiritus TaxID=2496557 RepID=A0A5J5G1H1_9BACL|nr:GGDEF domain-containing protein [Paenibacillus spiritus]KAA9000399.1 GGDEF domain-containing protein [Paenibacillus spiritus]